MRSLRIEGESDADFRDRAERAASYAHILVEAALANHDIQQLIADPRHFLWSEEKERRYPTVRLDFDEAICIAGIGEGIAATRSKNWGKGPYIEPLRPDDPVDPMFITYVFKENSLYNRRFMQRKKLKELLGRQYRPLVQKAKGLSKTGFLDVLTSKQAFAIRKLLGIAPGLFWRLSKGKAFSNLPEKRGKLDLAQLDNVAEKPKQLLLPLERDQHS